MSYAKTLPWRTAYQGNRKFDFIPPTRNVTALSAALPHRILLIDSDAHFTEAFVRMAADMHVTVSVIDSNLTTSQLPLWTFDLIVLDRETNGGEFAGEVASDMVGDSMQIPVLIAGREAPDLSEQQSWTDNVLGFSDKKLGVESVLGDALSAYSTVKAGLENRKAGGVSIDHRP